MYYHGDKERRIKDDTEKGEGVKRGERENIHNFIWKANNKVGPEMTNFVCFLFFLSLLVMILGRVFTDFVSGLCLQVLELLPL